jgi:hypothetical protein
LKTCAATLTAKPYYWTLDKMNKKEIPDGAIEIVAKHINERNNRPSKIPIITIEGETETPHYFEIIPFDQIAYKIIQEESDIEVLKVAEEKVNYLKKKKNG